MNTKEFFDWILPESGLRCLALKMGKGFQHFYLDSNDALADGARRANAKQQDVYMACGSYASKSGRTQDNVEALRCLWLDIDTQEGKPRETYVDRREAMVAVIRFCADLGLPMPLVVSSGAGLHCYWRFNRDVSPSEWQPAATLLKAACKQWGLTADASRTSDCASILRPAGTMNLKHGKPVKVVHPGTECDFDDIYDLLDNYVVDGGVVLQGKPSAKLANLNSDLSAGLEYPPTSAKRIAEDCGVVRLMRDTQGNIDQPTWYGVLGIMAYCEEGDALAHEWSMGHPQYDADETQAKLEQARQFKPTTCAKLRDCQPSICAKCPLTLNSPISIGFPTVKEEQVSIPLAFGDDDDGETIEQTVTARTLEGYSWTFSEFAKFPQMCVKTVTDDEDGEKKTVWVPFCDTQFYAVNRIEHGPDDYSLEIEALTKQGAKRFYISTSTIAEGGAKLASELGRREIMANGNSQRIMQQYLTRWVNELKRTQAPVRVYEHFGWYDGDFLLGNKLLHQGGNREVLLRKTARNKGQWFTTQGDYALWKSAVNTLYNQIGEEGYQYMVLVGFAAPLLEMVGQYRGVTVYGYSSGSGRGKTTSQRIALSAWGNYDKLELQNKHATKNALFKLMGSYCNLPVLYDELTGMSDEEACETVFAVSAGRQKERLDQNSELRENDLDWCTFLLSSGNDRLSDKVTRNKAGAEARAMRIFELEMPNSEAIGTNAADVLVRQALDNYGHAGLEYASYVVQNRDKIAETLRGVLHAFNLEAGIEKKERYWAALQACVLTAHAICRKLGIVQFDRDRLKQYILTQVRKNRQLVGDSVQDMQTHWEEMLVELQPGVLVTEGEGDMRSSPCTVLNPHQRVFGPVVGRYIIPKTSNERERFVLSASAIRGWCAKKGISDKEMFEYAVSKGFVLPSRKDKFQLGKGTTLYGGQMTAVRVWEIVTASLDLNAGEPGSGLKIKGVINGGLSSDIRRGSEAANY